MSTEFTPFTSLGGGLLIGLAAVLLMLVSGRIFGATGILAGILFPQNREDFLWRLTLLAGMVTAPVVLWIARGAGPVIEVPVSQPMLMIGGVLVGIGVTLGAGCTSGHGVCGLARFSPRSLVATVTFMCTTAATVFAIRHMIGGG